MDPDEVDQIIDKYQDSPNLLIQILLEVQRENHWLSKEVLDRIGGRLNIPLNRIYHIASFYKAFSLTPRGRHEVLICMGTACYVRGGPRILDSVEQFWGIKSGQTTQDMKFTLNRVNCLGCCALGPVMVVDGKYYSKPSTKELGQIFAACE